MRLFETKTSGKTQAGGAASGKLSRGRQQRQFERGDLPDIPRSELTPSVRSAMVQLMEQVDQLKEDLSAAHELVSELENMADEDPLVPVLNRRGFMRELGRVIAYVKRYKSEAALVYLDLDSFKAINDTYGHCAGDRTLLHVGKVLLKNVRRSDIVGRLGGDEFAVVLHNANLRAARGKTDHLIGLIETEPVETGGGDICLGLSAGVVELLADDDPEKALERADRAMYERKGLRQASCGKLSPVQ